MNIIIFEGKKILISTINSSYTEVGQSKMTSKLVPFNQSSQPTFHWQCLVFIYCLSMVRDRLKFSPLCQRFFLQQIWYIFIITTNRDWTGIRRNVKKHAFLIIYNNQFGILKILHDKQFVISWITSSRLFSKL